MSSSAFSRLFFMSTRRRGEVRGPETRTFPDRKLCGGNGSVVGQQSCAWFDMSEVGPETTGMVPNLLMLKFPPWLPDREKKAFKEDNDGWMSGIVSGGVPAIPSRSDRNSKTGDFDILAPHRVATPLDVHIMGASFFGKCRTESRSAD